MFTHSGPTIPAAAAWSRVAVSSRINFISTDCVDAINGLMCYHQMGFRQNLTISYMTYIHHVVQNTYINPRIFYEYQ